MPGGPKSSIPRQGVRLPARKNKLGELLLIGAGEQKRRWASVIVNRVGNEEFYRTTDSESNGVRELN